jgi:alanyl-tRNA synthetase
MRRIEALVGPDALRHVNAERHLLEEVTAALGAGDPEQAPERARRAIERVKQLESELGKIRKGDRGSVVEGLAGKAQPVDGASLIVSSVPGEDVNGARELALALRDRMEREGPGAVVLGVADDGAKLVAAITGSLVDKGVTAKDLLGPAAAAIGGGAGGSKPNLAIAGGRNADALEQALGTVPVRLAELLAG